MRGALLLACLALAACGRGDRENTADPGAAAPLSGHAQAATPRPAPPAPAELQQQIETLARGFDGEVGVAVKDLQEGWTAGWRTQEVFPQQSVMKLWLAVALLDRVDRGEMALSDALLLTPADLSLHHQPIKARVLDDGRHLTTLDELLFLAIARSDNAATDVLLRHLGGTQPVEAVLARKGFPELKVGPEERLLHTRLAGLAWRPELAFPQVFDQARSAVPLSYRRAQLEAYARAPEDGATPAATVRGLEALKQGKLLSPDSTARLLRVMGASNTGRARFKAGLEPGWTIAHKTGTGPEADTLVVGYNDVALLTAPDGRVYSVAGYIGRTETGLRARQQFLSGVASAVVEHWKATRGPSGEAAGSKARLAAS